MKKMFWIVVLFLVIGGSIIKVRLDTDFGESDDRKTFLGEFWKWMKQVGGSVKSTVGHAIGQDWLPDVNETNNSTKVIKVISE